MAYTKEVEGYKFNNLNAAKSAQNSLRQHFNLPRPNCSSTEVVNVQVNEGSQGTFYYFLNDPVIPPILGGATTFLIDILEFSDFE